MYSLISDKTLRNTLLVVLMGASLALVAVLAMAASPAAAAEEPTVRRGGVLSTVASEHDLLSDEIPSDCDHSARPNPQEDQLHPDNCGITKIIRTITNSLSVLVGLVVVFSLVVAGIQYSSAGSNPQKVAAAKSRIAQALIALTIYIFLFTFLQWLVPGGVL